MWRGRRNQAFTTRVSVQQVTCMAWGQRTASFTLAWLTSLLYCSMTGQPRLQTSQLASSGHLSSPVSRCGLFSEPLVRILTTIITFLCLWWSNPDMILRVEHCLISELTVTECSPCFARAGNLSLVSYLHLCKNLNTVSYTSQSHQSPLTNATNEIIIYDAQRNCFPSFSYQVKMITTKHKARYKN